MVETGSFSAAAGRLGLTSSAVSKHVGALEESLGARLLERTTRSVRTTEVGRAFGERARAILEGVDEARDAVSAHQEEARGTLRLSAPMDFGRRHLADPLARFADQHPNVVLDVELSDRQVDLVADGFDLAIRIGSLPDSDLVTRRIAPCRRVLVAAPGYLEARGRPTTLRDLRHHEFIGYAFESRRSWQLVGEVEGPPVEMPIRHRVNNGELCCELATAGHGIALLPTFIAGERIRAGELEAVLEDAVDADMLVQVVYPHRRLLSAKVRLFVEHLASCYAPDPPWDR